MTSSDTPKSFGHCLRCLLETKGVLQKQLAEYLVVTESLISRWIHGTRVPPLSTNYVHLIVDYVKQSPQEYESLHKQLTEAQIYSESQRERASSRSRLQPLTKSRSIGPEEARGREINLEDPELNLFFGGPWHELTDKQREFIKTLILEAAELAQRSKGQRRS